MYLLHASVRELAPHPPSGGGDDLVIVEGEPQSVDARNTPCRGLAEASSVGACADEQVQTPTLGIGGPDSRVELVVRGTLPLRAP
eukprot:2450420-Heterocapsa_arctica.AAC.1